ncbi:MAG: DUF6443 domain-containing protein, partial [Bacteroidota bacterium]
MKAFKIVTIVTLGLLWHCTALFGQNTYNFYNNSWNYGVFVDNPGSGGGSVSVTIVNDILTVTYSGGWSPSTLHTGSIVTLATTPAIPAGTNIPLGIITGDYSASLIDGSLHTIYNGNGRPALTNRFDVTLTANLATLTGGGGGTSSGDFNYVTSYSPRVPTTNALSLSTKEEVMKTTSFFDGLGRTKQVVQHEGSPGGNDVILNTTYDEYGRVQKQYLPYTHNASTPGERRVQWKAEVDAFYAATNDNIANEAFYYYSESRYEQAPASRVLLQGSPGIEWSLSRTHTVGFQYRVNKTATDGAIKRLMAEEDDPIDISEDYPAGSLYITKVTDEDDNEAYEYKDKAGRIIMKKAIAELNSEIITRYIYDVRGNLRYVVQPKGMQEIYSTNNWGKLNSSDFRNKWVFQYRYDDRNRMVEKRVPGSDWVYMIYDNKDRVVLTQDGNQRTASVEQIDANLSVSSYEGKSYKLNGNVAVTMQSGFHFTATPGNDFTISSDPITTTDRWIFTKYDELNRPVLTGFYYDSRSRVSIQSDVSGQS